MSRGRKLALGLVVLVVLLAAAVAVYLGPIAPIATGYAAKTTCSGHAVSGRSVEDLAGDLPDNPLVPFLRTSADDDAGTVTTSLVGLWPSTAYATDGLGCTLAHERPAFAPLPELPTADPDTPWPAGEGPAALPAGVDGAALDAAIATAFTEDDPEGRRRNTRAVVVVEDGALIAERYGEGFGPDTPLLGWSMAKSVTNAIVGRLVGDGRLDPAATDLLPAWSEDERATISLDDLLRMSSGLAFEEVYDPGTDVTEMLFTPGDTGAFAAAQPLVAPPGTTWSYSSGTTNILCDLAHTASGRGPEMARELVFTPLGMRSAVMEPDATGGLVCSSYLYATARDWARFGQWFLQDGVWDGTRLLPEGWVADSTRPVPAETGPEHPYGAQWWLNAGSDGTLRMPSVPEDAFWASGNEGQQVVVIPSEQLVVVRLGLSGEFDGIDWGLETLLAGVIEALG